MANTNYIYRMGTAPNTRSAVSQKSKVYGYTVGSDGFQHLGVITSFELSDSRGTETVRGVGYGDQVAELVPGVSDPISITLNKTLLYTMNIFQAIGYKAGIDGLVRALKHHRWPFDIKHELVFSEVSSTTPGVGARNAIVQPTGGDYLVPIKALFTFLEGCWLESYGAPYGSDSAMVAESSSGHATDILDGMSIYGEYIDSGLSLANGTPGKNTSLRWAAGAQPQTNLVP